MDEIRAFLLNRSSSTSRRSRSSHHSDFTLSGSSTPTSNTLRRATRTDHQENLYPLRDTDSQEHQRCQAEEAFALARERQQQRQHEEEERAHLHQNAQDAEGQCQEQQLRGLKHSRSNELYTIRVEPLPTEADKPVKKRKHFTKKFTNDDFKIACIV